MPQNTFYLLSCWKQSESVCLQFTIRVLLDFHNSFWIETSFSRQYVDDWDKMDVNVMNHIVSWKILAADSRQPTVTTLWLHASGPILVRVMACYLTAPSHYLNPLVLVLYCVVYDDQSQAGEESWQCWIYIRIYATETLSQQVIKANAGQLVFFIANLQTTFGHD